MPSQLKHVELDEVSLVDVPANQLAKITLTKRVVPEELLGVRFVLGLNENANTEVASVLFGKGWNQEQVVAFGQELHMPVNKVAALPTGGFHLEHLPSGSFTRLRTIVVGSELAKGLSQKLSFTYMQGLITDALREHMQEKFGKDYYVYVRDMFANTLIYETSLLSTGTASTADQGLYRIPYTVTFQDGGEPKVTFGEPSSVEIIYQDASKAMEEEDDEEEELVPDDAYDLEKKRRVALYERMGKLQGVAGKLEALFESLAEKANSCHNA